MGQNVEIGPVEVSAHARGVCLELPGVALYGGNIGLSVVLTCEEAEALAIALLRLSKEDGE